MRCMDFAFLLALAAAIVAGVAAWLDTRPTALGWVAVGLLAAAFAVELA